MNKKYLVIIALIIVLAFSLAACNNNTHKQDAVENTQSGQPIVNNGGVLVRQGSYIYYVNSYIGVDAENTFGSQKISCLMRANVAEDGTLSDKIIMVPKNIYSGIYIYGDWIYYTTPNVDKDKKGEINDTYLDIYRTSTDRTVTQRLYTINNRDADVFFSSSCVLVYSNNTISKIDLNKKNLKKIQDDDNYVTVLDKVTAVTHLDVDNAFGATLLAVQSKDDKVSYRNYNTLYAVGADGSAAVVIGADTYRTSAQIEAGDYSADAQTSVIDYVAEGDSLTLFYTSTVKNSVGADEVTLNCYKFDDTSFSFDTDKEKVVKENYSGTAIEALSYEDGAIVTSSALPYIALVKNNTVSKIATTDIARALSVKCVYDGYVYYTDSSSANVIYRFALTFEGETDNRVEEKVCDISMETTLFPPEADGGYLYYMDGTKYTDGANYLYRVKLDKAQITELIGNMSAADAADVEKAEEEE